MLELAYWFMYSDISLFLLGFLMTFIILSVLAFLSELDENNDEK